MPLSQTYLIHSTAYNREAPFGSTPMDPKIVITATTLALGMFGKAVT